MRVVSLLPSATEIVFALGHGSELVGRSVDCDFPDAALALPVVMHPRDWDSDAPSIVIDERVRRTRSRGESLYELDVDRLRQLRPDLLLTQDLCGVCSVTEREVREACQLAGVRPEVVSLMPRTLEDVWRSVEVVGRALGDPGGRCSALENPPIPIGTAAVLGTTPRGSGRMAGSPHLGGPLDPRHRGGRGRSARGS